MNQQSAPRRRQVRPLLTVPEFHHHLGGALGINAIRRLVKEGNIRSIPAGTKKRLIPATELHDWPQRATQANR